MKRLASFLLAITVLLLLPACHDPHAAPEKNAVSAPTNAALVFLDGQLYEIPTDETTACAFDESAEFYPLTPIPAGNVPGKQRECNLRGKDLQLVRYNNVWIVLRDGSQYCLRPSDLAPDPDPGTEAPTGMWEVAGVVRDVRRNGAAALVQLDSADGISVLVCTDETPIRAHDLIGRLYDLTSLPDDLIGCTATANVHTYLGDDVDELKTLIPENAELLYVGDLTLGVCQPEEAPQSSAGEN